MNQLTKVVKPGKMNGMNLDRRLLRQALSARGLFLLAIFAGVAAGLAAVFQSRQLSRIIARVYIENQSLAEVHSLLWIFLAVLAVRVIAGFISEAAASRAAIQVKENLREALVRHILALGPAYAEGERSGELINTASQGIEALEAYFSQFLPQIALSAVLPLAYLAVVMPTDPLSGVVLLVTGPLIPVFMFLIGQNAQALTRRQWLALGRMSAFFLDTLQGLATLKSLGRSEAQVERIAEISERYRQTTLQVLRITFLSALALELLGTIGTAIISVQIGLRLLYGWIGFEQAFFLLLLAPDFYLPLRALGLRFHASMSGVTAARSIYQVLELPFPDLSRCGELEPAPSLRRPFELRLENISFCYPGREQPALQDVSLTIRSGKTTALIGESGAGKSTLAQLILCFAAPQQGKIQINGVPLNQIRVADWRAQIAWVPQRPHLFDGTIAENLRIAHPQAGEAEMRSALAHAHLLQFIEDLPQGMETRIGENGARLSSGQAQRLALARAFLRDAPFLVLDEPTAHLDVEQEAQLQETVRALCQGRTVLLIAHRLPSVLQAGQVIVLENGRVEEYGSPQVLLAQKGRFSRLTAVYGGQEGRQT